MKSWLKEKLTYKHTSGKEDGIERIAKGKGQRRERIKLRVAVYEELSPQLDEDKINTTTIWVLSQCQERKCEDGDDAVFRKEIFPVISDEIKVI